MENAMQMTFRMLAVRAAFAAALSLAAGSALAQTTNDAEPGKPLSLLNLLTHHGAAKKPEARTVAKPAPRSAPHLAARAPKKETRTAERVSHRRIHLAARHKETAPRTEPETAAAAPTPAAPWPLGQMAAPAAAAAPVDPIAAAPPQDPAPAPDAQVSELVVGGHTVQIASPDQVNAIDLAADQQGAEQPSASAAPADDAAAAAPAMAQGDAADDAEDDATPSDTANAAGAAAAPDQVATFARQADSETDHRPSWLAELLATLGGAIAAGSVAWFLIGSAPQRRFG
jgi:hypothetical protein